MSYESTIAYFSPILYIPVLSENNGQYLDVVFGRDAISSGSTEIIRQDSFPKRNVLVPGGSNVIIDSSDSYQFYDPPISFGVWVKKTGNPGKIFSLGTESQGFALESNENNNIVVFYGESEPETTSFRVSDSFHLFIISFDGAYFGGEDGEDPIYQDKSVKIFFDGQEIFSKTDFSMYSDPIFYINSYYNELSDNSVNFAHFFVVNKAITQQESKDLYDLGIKNIFIRSIESDSFIPYIDFEQSATQTSWQAYGIVTGKP